MYPPNDWGCRCDVIPTDEAPTKGYETFDVDVKIGFNNNPAVSGKVFKSSTYEKSLSKKERNNALIMVLNFFSDEFAKQRLTRYSKIKFKPIDGIKNNGVLEIFTTGKQNKKEFGKNKRALKILAGIGEKYKMLPIINDNKTNPDAFNITFNRFVDVKVAEGINGKNIMQSALKEASRQQAQEVVIHLTKKPRSYREMYEALRHSITKNRNKKVSHLTVIFPNNEVKIYEIEKIKAKIDKS